MTSIDEQVEFASRAAAVVIDQPRANRVLIANLDDGAGGQLDEDAVIAGAASKVAAGQARLAGLRCVIDAPFHDVAQDGVGPGLVVQAK